MRLKDYARNQKKRKDWDSAARPFDSRSGCEQGEI